MRAIPSLTRHRRPALLGAICILTLPTQPARAAEDPLDPVRSRLQESRAELKSIGAASAPGGTRLAELRLASGDLVAVPAEVNLQTTDPAEQRILMEALLRLHRFDEAQALLPRFQAPERLHEPEDRAIVIEWAFLTGDLEAADQITARGLAESDSTSFVDLLAAGRLRLALLDPDGAERHFLTALGHAESARQRMSARTGLAQVAQKRLDWDGSLEFLTKALAEDCLDPKPVLAMIETRIRRGETDAATAAAELVLELDPFNESAHYMLGNGYARKSYTQLFSAYPDAFADSLGEAALASADAMVDAGDAEAALRAYAAIASSHPYWADVQVRLGSLELSRGAHEKALPYFQQALLLCPEYGRAHHGVAKSLEQMRMVLDIHRAEDDSVFAVTPMPEVPDIEKLVVNWNALSPRHQKRVALSVAPWRRYLPVLIAGGHTYYIKPVYQLLSQTPGGETLRDLRISYDSRLWDDVRGCGGYHTVTGLEDVERTIYENYDTVLHELTHQVHGVLPPETSRTIEDLYRQAKQRDEVSGEGFLSRYAGGSVWEYFAEGANARSHPRRNEYDVREIVRERLDALDPALGALVARLEDAEPIEPCYPIAYANRGHDELERGAPEAAIAAYQQALDLEPTEPNALGSMIYALQVSGSAKAAFRRAEDAVALHPNDGNLAILRANSAWHSGQPLAESIQWLEEARSKVRSEDLPSVDLAIGRMRWILGDSGGATEAYDRALAIQSDLPEAIWGRASCQALAQSWDAAWSDYERAVRSRTGIVDLRCDYVRDLLRAGEVSRAAEQIDAARLLDPTDPQVRALEAWLHLTRNETEAALEGTAQVLADAPWCALAAMVQARALAARGESTAALESSNALQKQMNGSVPRYEFRPQWGRYDEVETFPAVERELVAPGGPLALP